MHGALRLPSKPSILCCLLEGKDGGYALLAFVRLSVSSEWVNHTLPIDRQVSR